MKILTVWHRLLIYFLKRKNEILQTLTGITYVSDDDIEEIKTWPKADVKKVLDSMSSKGDPNSCPWCITNAGNCSNCTYGKRNRKCSWSASLYSKILDSMRNSGLIEYIGEGICTSQDIKSLITEVIKINKILPEIL